MRLRGKMMEARRLALLEADLVVRVVDHTERPEWYGPGEWRFWRYW